MSSSQVLVPNTAHPMYSVKMISPNCFIVAGGGGATKSGIPNSLQIFSLDIRNPQDLTVISAEEKSKIDTGIKAVMNFDLVCSPNSDKVLLATGQDETCEVYEGRQELFYLLNENSIPIESVFIPGQQAKVDVKKCRKSIDFSFNKLFSIPSVTTPDGKSFQKCVCWSQDGLHMATGGSDGYLKIWDWPKRQTIAIQKVFDKCPIDSVSISPDGSKLLTIGELGGHVWHVKTGQKFADIPVVPSRPPTFKGAPVKVGS